jgi:hypothetical protein
MTDQWTEKGASDVRLDLSRLKGETSDTDTKYTVALAGPADERWIEAYSDLQAELGPRKLFELDAARGLIRFSCRTVDGTGVVFEALDRLEALVERANGIAAVRRAASPRITFGRSVLRAR